MSELESAIDEIKRVLIGNKSREVEEVYLKNAIRYIREYGSQPTLNENQQIVLEYLKKQFGKYDDVFVRSIFSPIDDLISECWDDELNTAFEQLDLKQEIQVLEVFGQWALEQEEE